MNSGVQDGISSQLHALVTLPVVIDVGVGVRGCVAALFSTNAETFSTTGF
jgi:hypothetical protein